MPLKFDQAVIVFGIDEGELALGKGYSPYGAIAKFEIAAGVEIRAGLVCGNDPPSTLEICFLAAAKDGTGMLANHPGREKAVVATI